MRNNSRNQDKQERQDQNLIDTPYVYRHEPVFFPFGKQVNGGEDPQ